AVAAIAAFLWLLRKMHLSKRVSCALTIPALLALMFLTGMTYSVMRAGIMMLIFLLSEILFQRRDSLNSLGIALIVISVVNPYAPQSLSLKLSALSTLGIILCNVYIMPKLTEFFALHEFSRIAEKPVKLLAVTCAAVGFTLPVTVTAFGGYSFAVFPANLFAVPLAEICMICSAFGTLIGLISLSIPNLFAFAAGLGAKLILKIAGILSSLRFLRLSVEYKDACLIMAAVFIFLALAAFMAYSGKKIFPLAGYLAAGIFLFSSVFFAFSDSLDTTLTVFDTGNGSAAYLSSGDDCILLGCGGDSFDGAYAVKKLLGNYKGDTDAVILPGSRAEYTSYLNDVSPLLTGSDIYCDEPGYYLKLLFPGSDIIENADNFSIGDISVSVCRDGGGKSAYIIESKDLNLLYSCDPLFDFSSLPEKSEKCDVMLCRADCAGYPAFDGLKLVVIQADAGRGTAVQDELINKGINAAATAGCGNIVITADSHAVKAERR
ncbi:MAG: ComEC/Rec2 family competence protein, partial [Clostridia bacterium]|nr:ComEC/Rec2 family competence protein [Clostridia bacterium]